MLCCGICSRELLYQTKPDEDVLQNHIVTENPILSVFASQGLLQCVTKWTIQACRLLESNWRVDKVKWGFWFGAMSKKTPQNCSSFHSLAIFRLSKLNGTFYWEQTVKQVIVVSNYAAFPELWNWCAQKVWQLKCREWNQDIAELSRRFSWMAYWDGLCTTAALLRVVWTPRNGWGLPWNPTRVFLWVLLWQWDPWVQLGGKNLALIFKIHWNGSWVHVKF